MSLLLLFQGAAAPAGVVNVKVGGTFVERAVQVKVAGVFVTKPQKVKVGGVFITP